MSSRYVPGTSNPYFPKHKYFGIPIHRNIQAVSDVAMTAHAGPGGAVRNAVEVEILTPEHLWSTFQAEAEDMIKLDGSMDGHWEARNKRINAAYARLWLADDRFQWAGLAAFASKQVGCGLLHAAETIEKNRRTRDDMTLSIAAGLPGAEMSVLAQAGMEGGAAYMHKQLGFGNEHLFLDIYPLHRFYMERGWTEFNDHLPKRQNRRYAVYWNVDRHVLPFGTPFQEIRSGFDQIRSGNLIESVRFLARHEQINILQKLIYNDRITQQLLNTNQYAVVTGVPTGDAENIELTLSAQCKAKRGFTFPFSKDKCAKLWVVEQRMKFVLRVAEQFNKLLNGPQRSRVEDAIHTIAAGGGVS